MQYTLFGGRDEAGGRRLVGLGIGEVGDGVSLDEWRRDSSTWSCFRRVRQQVSRVVDATQVAATALLLLLATVKMLYRCRRSAHVQTFLLDYFHTQMQRSFKTNVGHFLLGHIPPDGRG